jgi:hypothetical protein
MTSSPTSKPLLTRIKCLIIINDNKYVINVDNHLNGITFNQVFNEIQKQIETKPEISSETHIFEVSTHS